MLALLLLGIIPGTTIQIDFTHWLFGIALCMVLIIGFSIRGSRRQSAALTKPKRRSTQTAA